MRRGLLSAACRLAAGAAHVLKLGVAFTFLRAGRSGADAADRFDRDRARLPAEFGKPLSCLVTIAAASLLAT